MVWKRNIPCIYKGGRPPSWRILLGNVLFKWWNQHCSVVGQRSFFKLWAVLFLIAPHYLLRPWPVQVNIGNAVRLHWLHAFYRSMTNKIIMQGYRVNSHISGLALITNLLWDCCLQKLLSVSQSFQFMVSYIYNYCSKLTNWYLCSDDLTIKHMSRTYFCISVTFFFLLIAFDIWL